MNIISKKYNIKILILVCMIFASLFINNGCKEVNNVTGVEKISVSNHMKDSKIEMAKKLLADFKVYYNQFNNDFEDKYPQLMAFDRIVGLLGVYKEYLGNNDLIYVKEKSKYIDTNLWCSPAYFGYSKSGLHFIAFKALNLKNSYLYKNTIDDRGTFFLSSFLFHTYVKIF